MAKSRLLAGGRASRRHWRAGDADVCHQDRAPPPPPRWLSSASSRSTSASASVAAPGQTGCTSIRPCKHSRHASDRAAAATTAVPAAHRAGSRCATESTRRIERIAGYSGRASLCTAPALFGQRSAATPWWRRLVPIIAIVIVDRISPTQTRYLCYQSLDHMDALVREGRKCMSWTEQRSGKCRELMVIRPSDRALQRMIGKYMARARQFVSLHLCDYGLNHLINVICTVIIIAGDIVLTVAAGSGPPFRPAPEADWRDGRRVPRDRVLSLLSHHSPCSRVSA